MCDQENQQQRDASVIPQDRPSQVKSQSSASMKCIMSAVLTAVILFITMMSSVHSYGYGMFGRGPWMAPFRPYLPSPFASPFGSPFSSRFAAGGFSGLHGGMPGGMGMGAFPGFSMKRAGFAPIPSPAGISPFGLAPPAVGGVSPFASAFSSYRFFPSSYPFAGFGSASPFGAGPGFGSGAGFAAPAAFAPAPLSSMGSFASASRPSFSFTKLGSSSSSSSGSG